MNALGRLRAWPVWLAVAGFIATVSLDGPRALASDGHPLQRLSAALMMQLGATAYRLRLTPARRLMLTAAGVWLGLDEALNVHECVKWRFALWRFGGDPLVLGYGVGGIVIFALLMRRFGWRAFANPFAVCAILGALSAVAGDLAPATPMSRPWWLILEEGGELLAVSASSVTLAVLPRTEERWWPGWAVALALAALGFEALAPLRPMMCPAQFLH